MKLKIAQVSGWALCQYLITLLALTYPGCCNAVQGKAEISAIGEKEVAELRKRSRAIDYHTTDFHIQATRVQRQIRHI